MYAISKDNRKEAFDKFYSVLDYVPEDKRIAKNIEIFFHILKILMDQKYILIKIIIYKDKFSDKFPCFLSFNEMCISYDNNDFDKSYSPAIKNI